MFEKLNDGIAHYYADNIQNDQTFFSRIKEYTKPLYEVPYHTHAFFIILFSATAVLIRQKKCIAKSVKMK